MVYLLSLAHGPELQSIPLMIAVSRLKVTKDVSFSGDHLISCIVFALPFIFTCFSIYLFLASSRKNVKTISY